MSAKHRGSHKEYDVRVYAFIEMSYFLEKEDDPRPLHLDDAYGHFINYSHKTLQSNTTVRLKPPSAPLHQLDMSSDSC